MLKTALSVSALALLASGAFTSLAHADDKTLTISVYAFAQDEFKDIVYTPFEQKCGC